MQIRSLLLPLAILLLLPGAYAEEAAVHQATGFKTGEATDTTIRVWTRLTARAEPNSSSGPLPEIRYAVADSAARPKRRRVEAVVYPAGKSVADLRHAAPGVEGETRVLYRLVGSRDWSVTSWGPVDPSRDFTRQLRLEGLLPDSRYEIQVEGRASRGAPTSSALTGTFRTAPASNQAARVVFAVSTGQAFKDRDTPQGYRIYAKIRELDPSFFVHTGDIVYYDNLAKTQELARYHWQRTYGLPSNVDFHRLVGSYFIKDDHDTWQNDCWPAMKNGLEGKDMFRFTFEQGLAIFPEQVPMGKSTYRTRRWGKDLQVWFVEGRDFRSPNTAGDDEAKTIWGAEQLRWFESTFVASDATFRLLISPTPIVGPDRVGKKDNHSNSNFTYEGRRIRALLAGEKNVAVICGDRHWQYMSVHPKRGVREYSCGPASDQHAGGWKKSDFREKYHRYLNVIGGFLSVTVERVDDRPIATFRFHDVGGKVRFEDRLAAAE